MRRNGARFALLSAGKRGYQTLLLRLSAVLRHVLALCEKFISHWNFLHKSTWPAFQPSLPRGLCDHGLALALRARICTLGSPTLRDARTSGCRILYTCIALVSHVTRGAMMIAWREVPCAGAPAASTAAVLAASCWAISAFRWASRSSHSVRMAC